MLTPKSVLPVFFSLAIFFAPLGGVLLWGSNEVCYPLLRCTGIE